MTLTDIATSRDCHSERARHKQELARACRILAWLFFDGEATDHISIRDPVANNHYWTNSIGISHASMSPDDLLLVDSIRNIAEGTGDVDSAALRVHGAIYEARPEIVSAARGQGRYGKAWSSLGRKLEPITLDACAFYRDHAVHKLRQSADDADGVVDSLGAGKALVLQNRGLMTVGTTLETGVFWLVALENACCVQLLAESAGSPISMSHEIALQHRSQRGSEEAAKAAYFKLRQRFNDAL